MRTIRNMIGTLLGLAFILLASTLPVLAVDKGLENPLKFTSIQKFVEGVLQAIVMIALPIITIFIVYAGFLFIAARGNESKLSNAKHNFQYVIIGTIMILSAWVLATLIGGTVTQLLG
ncbi:MAG: TrbC/VirB2 family protein [Minisyncoccia bacterium]